MNSGLIFAFILVGLFGPLIAGVAALIRYRDPSANTFIQIIHACSATVGIIGTIAALYQISIGALGVSTATIPLIGIVVTLDGLSAFFLLIINLGVLISSLFAIPYLPRYATTYSLPALQVASAIFILAMQAVVLASSPLAFLLFWELMSIAAYFLVIADREPASIKAGMIYLVMAHAGFSCILAGFLVLAHGNPLANFTLLAHSASSLSPAMQTVAFFLFLIGFGSKAGLMPLHQWLPLAHPQAPSNSSALMSGVMLKVAVYGFLRVTLYVLPHIDLNWAIVIVVISLLSAALGVLMAAIETDLKRVLAWSSIENLGLIFFMIGMGFVFKSLGLPSIPFFVAALLHCLNHAIFKSGLFLAAGAIISERHTRDIDEMGGLAASWPLFSLAFLGLVFGAAALPPFGTFYGEWLTFQHLATTLSSVPLGVSFLLILSLSILALVSGLAIFTFVKTFADIFLGRSRAKPNTQTKPLPQSMVWIILSTTLISFIVGIFIAPIANVLTHIFLPINHGLQLYAPLSLTTETIRPLFITAVFIGTAAIGYSVYQSLLKRRQIKITNTWDCGQPITAHMEYTATGFAAPIRFFFRSMLMSKKHMVTERIAPQNPWILRHTLEWDTTSHLEEQFYAPLGNLVLLIATKIKRLQNGIIQFYILLILITLVLILGFAI